MLFFPFVFFEFEHAVPTLAAFRTLAVRAILLHRILLLSFGPVPGKKETILPVVAFCRPRFSVLPATFVFFEKPR